MGRENAFVASRSPRPVVRVMTFPGWEVVEETERMREMKALMVFRTPRTLVSIDLRMSVVSSWAAEAGTLE